MGMGQRMSVRCAMDRWRRGGCRGVGCDCPTNLHRVSGGSSPPPPSSLFFLLNTCTHPCPFFFFFFPPPPFPSLSFHPSEHIPSDLLLISFAITFPLLLIAPPASSLSLSSPPLSYFVRIHSKQPCPHSPRSWSSVALASLAATWSLTWSRTTWLPRSGSSTRSLSRPPTSTSGSTLPLRRSSICKAICPIQVKLARCQTLLLSFAMNWLPLDASYSFINTVKDLPTNDSLPFS